MNKIAYKEKNKYIIREEKFLTPVQKKGLKYLLKKHYEEVVKANPELKNLVVPYGLKKNTKVKEKYICLIIKNKLCGFLSYYVDDFVLNETGFYVDISDRGKKLSYILFNKLVNIAFENRLIVIYFYNITWGGEICIKNFSNKIQDYNQSDLRFFFYEKVIAVVLEKNVGCANFDDKEVLLPCFYKYKQDVIVLGAKDNYIFTNYGKLLDINSGYWYAPLGYKNSKLDEIMIRGYSSHLFGYIHPPALTLAKKLCNISNMEKVGFNTSGSSVIDEAIRIAWQYSAKKYPNKPDRNIIVSLKGGFYGSSATCLVVAGINIKNHEYNNYMPNCNYNIKIDIFDSVENPLDEIITKNNLQNKIAGFIFEPVLGVRGAFEIQKEKLRAVFETCKKYDIITIADEISTGLGRTGKMFACNHYDLLPDIMCLGKAFTNGLFPLAAILLNHKVCTIFYPPYEISPNDLLFGSTLGGHPTGSMIALKVLDMIEEKIENNRIQIICNLLWKFLDEIRLFNIVKGIHGKGLMAGIEFANSRMAESVQLALRTQFINCIPEGRILMLMPPYTITDDELDYFFLKTNELLRKLSATN